MKQHQTIQIENIDNDSSKNWETLEFEKCLEKVMYTNKIHRKNFKKEGRYPIISQEKEFINGYWNEEKDLFKVDKPVVLFGDHTQVIKYIDFDFVLGADGVKILKPKDNIDTKYFYYYLQNIDLGSLGYARHYRLLKEINVAYPPLSEQKRIVAILDEDFEAIARAKENTEQNLKNAKEIFESYLQLALTPPQGDALSPSNSDALSLSKWEEKKLGEVCEFQRGLTYSKKDEVDFSDNIVLRSNNVDLETHKLIFDDLKYIDSSIIVPENKKVQKGALIICTANGSKSHLGKVALIEEDYNFYFGGFMGLIKPQEDINSKFLFYLMISNEYKKFIHALADGANINNLKFSDLSNFPIPLPPLPEQQAIVHQLDTLRAETQKLEAIYTQKLNDLEELKKSLLQKAFAGELVK